jgi:hypothetical protein
VAAACIPRASPWAVIARTFGAQENARPGLIPQGFTLTVPRYFALNLRKIKRLGNYIWD